MIAYFDTSALLKLYLDEGGSNAVKETLHDATAVCTNVITYAELRAALAQAVRLGRVSTKERANQLARLESDWLTLQVVAIDERMARRAGELAERFALRGYASVHLAAAERASDAVGGMVPFAFAAFDRTLCRGAELLGLDLLA